VEVDADKPYYSINDVVKHSYDTQTWAINKERERILGLIEEVEEWVKNEYGTYLQEIILPNFKTLRGLITYEDK
jgi:hypothetical protein